MGKVSESVGKATKAAATAAAIYTVTVKVEGRPVKEPTKPATIKILGIPIFERDASLNRYWFGGLISRGKSAAAKRATEGEGEQ